MATKKAKTKRGSTRKRIRVGTAAQARKIREQARQPGELHRIPDVVPAGQVVVHNHVKPTRQLGTRGFRAWLAAPDPERLEVCDCGWAPGLGQHFRIAARHFFRRG